MANLEDKQIAGQIFAAIIARASLDALLVKPVKPELELEAIWNRVLKMVSDIPASPSS
jgi:hypothetical protein